MGWRNHIGLLLFLLAIGLLPLVLPGSYFKLIHIGIFALICIGLSLLIGYAGQLLSGTQDFTRSAHTPQQF